jgi:hypothetical protein
MGKLIEKRGDWAKEKSEKEHTASVRAVRKRGMGESLLEKPSEQKNFRGRGDALFGNEQEAMPGRKTLSTGQ